GVPAAGVTEARAAADLRRAPSSMTRAVELTLPAPERRWASALAAPWTDLLYRPGPGFASPLEPGLFRASFVIVPRGAVAVRVTSLVIPAFGDEVCRLRLEPVPELPHEAFGSFFEPHRRARIWSMGADRRSPGSYAPDEKDWYYEGPALAAGLSDITRVRVLREQVRAGAGEGAHGWTADRGLVFTTAAGAESLLLAQPEREEHALFLPAVGPYRVLLDPTAPTTPGAGPRELLGYGERDEPFEVGVVLDPL
ncbi:MAG TPA: hypothetical protein VJU81_22975, partial [Methylomirabilota bacterium]|nr:hypothetical protein [Methylomirabilota bacterium]